MVNERVGLRRFASAEAGIAATAPAVATRGIAPDEGVQLRVPREDTPSPEVSILIPALDEGITIGRFVEWCKEGLARAGAAGEILIVDTGVASRRWLRAFPYSRTVGVTDVGFVLGLSLTVLLVVDYVRGALALSLASPVPYLGVLGLAFLISSFVPFTFLLLLHALILRIDAAYGVPR